MERRRPGQARAGLAAGLESPYRRLAGESCEGLLRLHAEEFDGDDLAGPVPVAVAGTLRLAAGAEESGEESPDQEGDGGAESEESPEARLIVIGDSDFAANQLIGEFRNRDLFVNAVNWLLGDVEAISIRPDQARASRMQLSGEQFLQIRYLSLFVLPQAIAVFGVFAWWSRRRAPGR